MATKLYQFTIVIEPDEDVYHGYVPALRGCHTFGDTVEEVRANLLEAIALHLECLQSAGESFVGEPEPMFITRLSVPVTV